MSKSNTFENQIALLTFNGTALPWSNSNLYIALHTADPGEAGDQTTNEATYTGYARVAVSRDGAGWTVSGADGTTITFRDVNDTKDRIVATVDADGNRSAVTKDVT